LETFYYLVNNLQQTLYVTAILSVFWGVAFLFIFISCMIVSGIILKFLRTQIGPTCGFYALSYIASKIENINFKKTAKEIIKKSIEDGDSYIGEIFDMKKFLYIAKKHFPLIEINLKEFSSQEDLDELLKDNYLIIPTLEEKRFLFFTSEISYIPHYYVVEGCDERAYICRETFFKCRKSVNKNELVTLNVNLEHLPMFCWNCYYKNKRSFFNRILYYIADFKFYRILDKNIMAKRKKLINTYSQIDMKGKVLAIKKHKNMEK